MCLFDKNYAKMSVFLEKALKIRGGWGFCPLSLWRLGASPPDPNWNPSLNPGCATAQAYKVLLPPSKFWASYATVLFY